METTIAPSHTANLLNPPLHCSDELVPIDAPSTVPVASLPAPAPAPTPTIPDPDRKEEKQNPLRQSEEEEPTHIDGIDATRAAACIYLTMTFSDDAFATATTTLRTQYNLLSGQNKEACNSLPIVHHAVQSLKQFNLTSTHSDLNVHPSIIHATLSLIGDLAYNVDCLNQKYLIQQEAHVAVLETMRNHSNSNDAAIQEIACVALRCLARASRNIISIAASGGIVTILQTMRKHGTVATLQIEGFKALFNLAFDPANQESIVVECQGLDVVRDAFVYHVDNPHVCEFGANLLHNLAFKNSKNKLRISQHGMIKMILSAMSNHPQATKVIIEACRALMSLAFAAECQNVIAECGGIEQVFQSMTLLKESKDVQVEGCKVLCTMGKDQNTFFFSLFSLTTLESHKKTFFSFFFFSFFSCLCYSASF